MENSSENKRLAINLISNCIAFAVNFIISFFLTPYIVEHIGKEVYGFVSLGNNFVNYASLISLAINSMASRFITIKIHRNDYETANKYFASVLLSNIIICLILLIPSIFIVVFLDRIVDVPSENVIDIKVLWALLFINFFINLIGDVYKIATFAKDRVDLSAKRNIEAYIIKAIILIIAYYFFNPFVLYIGIATIISTIYNTIVNIRYTKKLMPEIKFNKNNFDKNCLKELFFSGIWNTVSRVGSIALTELDLLLSNLLIDASAMGTLSLVKTIPNYMTSFTSTITTTFMPQLTIAYANNEKDSKLMLEKARNSIRILLFFNSIMYGILIAFSDKFYSLWLPNYSAEEVNYMYYVGIIAISGCFISAVSNVMFNIFNVYNKLKLSSITVIITGIVSCICTYFVVKYTNLGLYAIAGVSVILVVIRNVAIIMPYAAKLMNLPWYTFYKDVMQNIFIILISIAIGVMYKSIINVNSWLTFLCVCIISAITIMIINYFLVLKKEERKIILRKIFNKKGWE